MATLLAFHIKFSTMLSYVSYKRNALFLLLVIIAFVVASGLQFNLNSKSVYLSLSAGKTPKLLVLTDSREIIQIDSLEVISFGKDIPDLSDEQANSEESGFAMKALNTGENSTQPIRPSKSITQSKHSLGGQVFDHLGSPLGSVTVDSQLRSLGSTLTDSAGVFNFEINAVVPAVIKLNFSKENFLP
ncbi:MAG: hypothetical protein ACI9I4_002319 [Neolewinella sp.]|jgi:hypothetical protein